MSLKAFAAKIFANRIAKKTDKWVKQPVKTQQKVFNQLITEAKNTVFGREHGFDTIKSHQEFTERVPIRDYGVSRARAHRFYHQESAEHSL